jgi:hypothetical protein
LLFLIGLNLRLGFGLFFGRGKYYRDGIVGFAELALDDFWGSESNQTDEQKEETNGVHPRQNAKGITKLLRQTQSGEVVGQLVIMAARNEG